MRETKKKLLTYDVDLMSVCFVLSVLKTKIKFTIVKGSVQRLTNFVYAVTTVPTPVLRYMVTVATNWVFSCLNSAITQYT